MNTYMTPREWGPVNWHYMKCIATHYPKNPTLEKKNQTVKMFIMIREFLPCPECVMHHKRFMIKYPIIDYLCCNKCLMDWIRKAEQYSKQQNKSTTNVKKIVPIRKKICKYKKK